MIHAIKTPLMEGMRDLSSLKLNNMKKLWRVYEAIRKLPEPTKDKTWHPNTHKIIEFREWFYERYWFLRFTHPIFNFVVIIYDFDAPWRFMIDKIKREASTLDWAWFKVTWNIIYLKRWFLRHCCLNQTRMSFIQVGFNLVIAFSIPLSFWLSKLESKIVSFEWKEENYGVTLIPAYHWWVEIDEEKARCLCGSKIKYLSTIGPIRWRGQCPVCNKTYLINERQRDKYGVTDESKN